MPSIRIFKYRDVLPQLFNLLIRGRLDFRFELVPYQATGLPFRKRLNLFLAGLNQHLPRPVPFGAPVFAQVEPVNFCNLSCPLCLTVSETSARTKAALSYEQFSRLIDDVGDTLLLIVLWMWGEPFLNPALTRMIAYAKARGVFVHCSTNGNVPFDAARASAIVDSGLDTLIVGVDGATQDTYERYRQGGSLDRVWENVRALLRARDERGSPTPRVNLRFVVMKHNEHEIPAIRERARSLGVDYLSFKTVDLPTARGACLDPAYAPDEARYRRYTYEHGGYRRKAQPFVCLRPWKRITVDAAGAVIPCEYDHRSQQAFGTIGTDGEAGAIWKGSRAAAFRRSFGLGWNGHSFCRGCTYKEGVDDDCTVEIETIRA